MPVLPWSNNIGPGNNQEKINEADDEFIGHYLDTPAEGPVETFHTYAGLAGIGGKRILAGLGYNPYKNSMAGRREQYKRGEHDFSAASRQADRQARIRGVSRGVRRDITEELEGVQMDALSSEATTMSDEAGEDMGGDVSSGAGTSQPFQVQPGRPGMKVKRCR